MIHKFLDTINNLDEITCKIMKHGLQFCFILCILSTFILLTYNLTFSVPVLYYIGIGLFRLSLTFGIEFIVCGIVVDEIKKQLI